VPMVWVPWPWSSQGPGQPCQNALTAGEDLFEGQMR
jgi:hypothetical protein